MSGVWKRGSLGKVAKDPAVLLSFLLFALQLLPLLLNTSFYSIYIHFLLLVVATCILAGRRLNHVEERRFWFFLAASFSFWAAARVVYILHAGEHWPLSFDVLTDLFYLGMYVCFFLAVARLPHRRSGWSRDNPLYLIQVFGGVLFIISLLVYFLAIPLHMTHIGAVSREPSFYMYALLDLILLGGLIYAWRSTRSGSWRLLYGVFAGVVVIWLGNDLLQGLTRDQLALIESGTLGDRIWHFFWILQFPVLIFTIRARPYLSDAEREGLETSGSTVVQLFNRSSLIVYVVLMPVIHFVFYGFNVLEAGARDEREVFLVLSLLMFAALAVLQQRESNRERRKALNVLSVLLEVGRNAPQLSGLRELLEMLRDHLGRVINTKNFFVALYDMSEDSYSFPYAVDEREEGFEFSREEMAKSLTGYVRRSGRALLADESQDRQLISRGEVDLVGTPAKSWLGVPLKTSRGVIGVVVVQSYSERFHYSIEDLELLESVSVHIAGMIERKRAEESVRRSLAWFEAIFEGSLDAVLISDPEGRVISANSAATELTGYVAHELMRVGLADLCSLEALKKPAEGRIEAAEAELMRKDGLQVEVEWSSRPIEISGETYVHCLVREISEKKSLERKLFQSQKLEALGQLAGGMAHDFNNLLTVITGHSQLAQGGLDLDHPLQKDLQEIDRASAKAAALIHELLAFSRKQMLRPQVFDLNEVVTGLEEMLRRLISEDISLAFLLSDEPVRVKADPNQFEQMTINLVLNARDAMPEGGEIRVQTYLDGARSRFDGPGEGQWAILEVSDTGIGMDPSIKSRIFDPFFTTKEVGKGTGLGLASVYGTVKQSGGEVFVESEPGKGSSFRIFLPAVE